jgi:hypothetical protein
LRQGFDRPSGFKQFEDPIEQVLTSISESGAATTYQNAEGANRRSQKVR